MSILLALALVSGAPPPPKATGFLDATQLQTLCAGEADPTINRALCLGYVTGAVDQLLTRSPRRPTARPALCLPKTMRVDEVADLVVRRMGSRRDLAGTAAGDTIRTILQSEFPCPNVLTRP